MSRSCTSSLSSDEEDAFDILRTSHDHDVNNESFSISHKKKKKKKSSTDEGAPIKTPAMMKTPSMDALTRKYEFLLAHDGDHGNEHSTPFLQTPILNSLKLERTRSLGSRNGSRRSSRNSSRRSSRSATPTRRPTLTAQKILHRLQSGDLEDNGTPRIPSSSPSWEACQGQDEEQQQSSGSSQRHATHDHQHRYRTQLKQNLEHKLKQLEKQQTLTPPRHEKYNQRQPSRSTPTSNTRRQPAKEPPAKREDPPDKVPLSLPNAPPSPSDNHQHRFFLASSTTTSTTMALTEAPSPAAATKPYRNSKHHIPLPLVPAGETLEGNDVGIVPLEEVSPYPEEESQQQLYSSSSPARLVEYKESNASYWHRWKMAETRLQQQKEEFEQEKEEWMQQLEKAHSANAKVEALVKRYDVQLRAVHNTCLQQDEESLDEDDDLIDKPEDEPLDPLHLLLLQKNGTEVDIVQWNESEDSDEQESSRSKTKRRMDRARTKNVILSHLVKLLEGQAEEQKAELQQQLKEEKEEKEVIWSEYQQLQQDLLEKNEKEKVLTPQKAVDNTIKSPPPTENDQVKALQHRLWLREQQYSQERKEFETKIQTLQADIDRHKINQHEVKIANRRENTEVPTQFDSLLQEKESLQARCDALQKECDQYQQQAVDAERSQKFKQLQQAQERAQLERQLAKAQEDLRGLRQAQEKVKAAEEKIKQMEAKHIRDRKEWESKLLQQGKRIAANAAGNNSNASKELQEKQRKRWESQLEIVQAEAQRYKQEAEASQEREDQISDELKDLKRQLERMEQKRSVEESKQVEKNTLKMLEMQQKYEQDQLEYKQQLDNVRAQRDEKMEQLEQFQAQLDAAETELGRLRDLLSVQKTETVPHNNQVTVLQEKIIELEKYLQTEREGGDCTKTKVSELEDEIQRLHEKYSSEQQVQQDSGIMAEKYKDLENELLQTKTELAECREAVNAENIKCKEATVRSVELELEIEQCKKQYSEEKDEWDIIVDSLKAEKDAGLLGSEKHQELLMETEELKEKLEQTKGDLDTAVETLRAEEDRRRQAEIRNSSLDEQLQELNEKFVQEMKQLEGSYRAVRNDTSSGQETIEALELECERLQNVLEEERSRYKETIEKYESQQHLADDASCSAITEKNSDLENQLRSTREELQPTVNSLNAQIENNNGKQEADLQRLEDGFEHEKEEWSQKLKELQTDKEFIQQKLTNQNAALEAQHKKDVEHLMKEKQALERSLEDAKAELEAGLRSRGTEAENYRQVVEKSASLEVELARLRMEKREWERELQFAKQLTEKNEKQLEEKKESLEREIEDIRSIHDKAIQDWRKASEQSNKEISRLQSQQDNLIEERNCLKEKLADAEQRIESLRVQADAGQREWHEKALSSRYESVDGCAGAVNELRREVQQISQQIQESNATVGDLSDQLSNDGDIFLTFKQLQQEVSETARKLSTESEEIRQNREVIARRLDEFEKNGAATPVDNEILLEQQKMLIKELGELRSQLEKTTCGSIEKESTDAKVEAELRQKELELASAKDELAKEKQKREAAENEAAMLSDQLSVYNEELMKLQTVNIQFEEGAQQAQKNVDESFCSSDCPPLDPDLDKQLRDLNKLIDQEMEEVRSICNRNKTETAIVPFEAPTEAREAMYAQTSLLIQSIRGLMSEDQIDEEQQSADVMQHLEVLSELMAEVDREDQMLLTASAPSTTSSEDLVEVRMEHEKAEGVLVQVPSQQPVVDRGETDLLRFELAQDDSMLDLLDEEAHDESDIVEAATSTTFDTKYFDATEALALGDVERGERSGAASPIQMMVEQTYNRCQVLERERCDLINVTLDLLAAAREANKAEIDAALAEARRKASEEMIKMKANTQAQVDQFWFKLCEKCQRTLMQG